MFSPYRRALLDNASRRTSAERDAAPVF